LFPLLCLILLPSLVWSQAAAKLSPRVRPFVREDAPKIALTHVRVIDRTGAAARADQTLLIEDGKIAAMGDAATMKIPDDTKTIDLTDRTVIRGLVGMHDHLYYPSPGRSLPLYPEHASSFPRLYLAGGVTSIRTTGSIETYTDLELKLAIDQGKMAGPRIHLTGPYLEGKGSFTPQMRQLTDAEDARRTVEYWIAEGATSFKADMNITPDELAAAVKAAHAHGLKVAGHLCSIGFREAAALGIDDLEHGLFVDTEFFPGKQPNQCPDDPSAPEKSLLDLDIAAGPVQDMIRDLVTHHVAITSTLPCSRPSCPIMLRSTHASSTPCFPTRALNTWSGAPRSPITPPIRFGPRSLRRSSSSNANSSNAAVCSSRDSIPPDTAE
jgi:imidazolonepropionase-like amidohydrolase